MTSLELTSVYSHSALLCKAVMHTFVHSVSDFWNPSHIQSDPSVYSKRMGFVLHSISRQKNPNKTEKNPNNFTLVSDSSSNYMALPKYCQFCLQIAKTASAVLTCYEIQCGNHAHFFSLSVGVWQGQLTRS